MFIPGVIALWAAFAALCASTFSYVQSIRGDEGARERARQFYALAVFGVVAASAMLLYLIVSHNFSIHYVFSYSDRSLPTGYLISTFWAGQEGSFLLWLFWGVLIGLALIRYARHYEDRTLVIYNLTLASLLLILLRQSPFRPLTGLPAGQMPFDGQGLNPLLQNPWMTIHPPIMFLGYAATAVPFAFAVAALWGRRYDEWVRASLPWALVTVVTLGCAILLGGYWAYVTLGWGGYWGWDPVENSSLVPWLASAALVHGMLLQRARGRFRKLNFSLAMLAYMLVVYATFLTRSGVLADFSVHSFVDLGITGWLVGNLVVFFLIGLAALIWRWREIPAQAGDEPLLSRTMFFVLAISAILGTAAMVLLGTSAPLITRLAAQPSQVSAAFYNRVTLPVGILFAALLGVVPFLHWRGAQDVLRKRLIASAGLAAVSTAAGVLAGAKGVMYTAFLFVALFTFFSNLIKTVEEVRKARFRVAGGYLAHVGLGLMLTGIITSSAYDRSEKVVLPLGESKQVMGYTLTFKGVDKPTPTAREAMLVQVTDPGGRTYVARPKMFRNEKSNQLVANPDVHVRLTHDIYIAPIEFDPGREPERGPTLELGKGESKVAGPYTITFAGFDMSGAHGDGQSISLGVKLEVVYGGTKQRVTPTLVTGAAGFESRPVTLPGSTGASVSIAGVDAGTGRVRLTLAGTGGEGAAMRASLHKGEKITYRGTTLTFDDFDLSDFDPQAGKIHIGAVFKVAGAAGANGSEVTALYKNDESGEQHEDAAVPGLDGVKLRIGKMNASDKSVEILVLDANAQPDPGEKMRFSLDLTVKPMIGLLWLGLVILLSGGIMAVVRRGGEFAGAESALAAAGK
jgi:cytochrome c-type biogenesis protein CcmF